MPDITKINALLTNKQNYVVYTGSTPTWIQMGSYQPFIDTHCHIMSLNCTPMTLVWGFLYLRSIDVLVLGLREKGKSRREVYSTVTSLLYTSLGFHDFGFVGRLGTDLIGKLLMGKLSNDQMKERLFWIVWTQAEIDRYNQGKSNKNKEDAGSAAKLTDLNIGRETRYSDFCKDYAFYFSRKQQFHMFFVLPMDLSHAHFWGYFGLPIYLPDNSLYYINDFIEVNMSGIGETKWSFNPNDYEPHQGWNLFTGTQTHLYYDFDLPAEFQKFRDFFLYKAGIINEKPEKFFIFFDDDEELAKSLQPLMNKILPLSDDEKNTVTQTMRQLYTKYKNELNKKYIHFLGTIKDQDNEKFEDYHKQIFLTEATAVRYPFIILPYYHYDPRRHYADLNDPDIINPVVKEIGEDDGKQPARLAEKIAEEHAFFTYESAYRMFDYKWFDSSKGTFLSIKPKREFTENYFANLFESKKISNKEVFKKMLFDKNHWNNKGIFWGFKMYTQLGYPADSHARYGFDCRDIERFPHLSDFYARCEEYGIPITVHALPQGMTIADSHNYQRYKGEMKDKYDVKESIRYIDDLCTDPEKWRTVLRDFPQLKINLAHFGGYAIWSGNPQRHQDWRESIARLVQDYANVYTDLSAFENKDNNIRESIGTQLADFIGRFPKLRNRILMGSDWYMTEAGDLKGVGPYYANEFELLKIVTANLSGTKFDAWYEFTVVNPLRFMGLINIEDVEEPEGKLLGVLDEEKTWLDKYWIYITEKGEDPNWRKVAEITKDEITDAKSEAFQKLNNLKYSCKIFNPEKITDPDNPDTLLILKE